MPTPCWSHHWSFPDFSLCSCFSGPFLFIKSNSNLCLFHSSCQILPCITFTYASVSSPLLDTLQVELRTGIWLMLVFLRAPSIVSLYNKYCTVARFRKCLSSCRGEQSEGDHQVEAFQNHACVARAWVRCVTSALEKSPLISTHKSLWWTLLHTHLTWPSSSTSFNISSALFYFLLLPFLL